MRIKGDNCTITVAPAGWGYRAIMVTDYKSVWECRSLTRLGAYRKAMRRYGWLHAPGTVVVAFEFTEGR